MSPHPETLLAVFYDTRQTDQARLSAASLAIAALRQDLSALREDLTVARESLYAVVGQRNDALAELARLKRGTP